MLRRCVSASLVLFVLGGFVIAGTYTGGVTKIEDGKITVRVRVEGEKKATEKTFKISKDAKFIKSKTKDEDEKELKLEEVKEMIAKAAEKSEKGKGKGKGRVVAASPKSRLRAKATTRLLPRLPSVAVARAARRAGRRRRTSDSLPSPISS